MTPAVYNALLASRGLSQRGGAARLFGIEERTARRWGRDPPKTAQLVLVLMRKFDLSAADVEAMLAQMEPPCL